MAFKLKDKGVHQCLKLVALLLSVHGMGVGVGNAWAVKSAAEIEQEAQNQVDAENAAKAPTVPRSPYQQVPVLQPVDDHDPDKLASEEDFRKAKKDQINANSALEGHKAESAQTLREMDASKNPLNAQLHELSNVQRLSPLPGVKVPPAGLIKKHEEALEDKKKELSRLKADYKTTHPGNYARAFGKGLKRLLPAKMDPKLAHIRGLQDAIDQETKQIKAEKQQLENKKNEITKELKKIDSEIKAYSKLSASKQKELDKAHHDAIRAAAARRHQYDLDVADAAQGGTSRFAKRGSAQDAATVPSRGAPVATTVDRDRGGLSGYPVLGTSSSSPPVAISRSAQGASSGDIIARLKELHTNPHVSVGGDPQIKRVKFDVLVVMAGNGFIYNDPTASAMQDYAKLAVQAEYALRDLYQEKLRNANNDEAVAKVALKSDPKAKVLTEVVRSSLASFQNPQANASLQQEVHAARDFLEKNKIKLPSVDLKKHNPSVASSCALVQESSPATPVVSSTAGSVANIAAYVAEHKRTTDAKLAQLTDQNEVLMQQNAALQRQLTAMRQSIRQNPEGVDRTNPGLGSLYGGVPREVAAYTPESSWVASSRRPGTQNLTSASSSRGAAASPSGGQYLDGASARQVTGTPESSVVENPQNLLYSRGRSWGYSPLLAASGNDSGSGLGGGAGGGSRELIAQEVQLPPALPPPPPTVHSLQGGVVLTEDEVLDENELNPNAHNSITAASPLAVPAPPLSETVRSQHMGPPSTIFPQYVGGSNSQTTPSLQSNQLRTGSGNPTAGGYLVLPQTSVVASNLPGSFSRQASTDSEDLGLDSHREGVSSSRTSPPAAAINQEGVSSANLNSLRSQVLSPPTAGAQYYASSQIAGSGNPTASGYQLLTSQPPGSPHHLAEVIQPTLSTVSDGSDVNSTRSVHGGPGGGITGQPDASARTGYSATVLNQAFPGTSSQAQVPTSSSTSYTHTQDQAVVVPSLSRQSSFHTAVEGGSSTPTSPALIPGADSQVSSTGSLTARTASFSSPVQPGTLPPTASTALPPGVTAGAPSQHAATVPSPRQYTPKPPTSTHPSGGYTTLTIPHDQSHAKSLILLRNLGLSIAQPGSSNTSQQQPQGMNTFDMKLIHQVAQNSENFSPNGNMRPEAIQALQTAITNDIYMYYSNTFKEAVKIKFDQLSSGSNSASPQ